MGSVAGISLGVLRRSRSLPESYEDAVFSLFANVHPHFCIPTSTVESVSERLDFSPCAGLID
jgi:hypothetical protein